MINEVGRKEIMCRSSKHNCNKTHPEGKTSASIALNLDWSPSWVWGGDPLWLEWSGENEVMGCLWANSFHRGSASSFAYSPSGLLPSESRVNTVLWQVENTKGNANIGVTLAGGWGAAEKSRNWGIFLYHLQDFCRFYIQVSVLFKKQKITSDLLVLTH